MKYADPTGHMQVCDRGDEGEEGVLHSSSCGSGANTEQIAKAFDKKNRGKGYANYYAHIHNVVIDLNSYLENINIEYENETIAMRDKRISDARERLRISVFDARREGENIHRWLDPHSWKSDTEFPEILGGGYIVNNSSGTSGGDYVAGSGEFSDFSIQDIVNYYSRYTPPYPALVPPGWR